MPWIALLYGTISGAVSIYETTSRQAGCIFLLSRTDYLPTSIIFSFKKDGFLASIALINAVITASSFECPSYNFMCTYILLASQCVSLALLG